MQFKAFEAAWKKYLLLGFQATLAATATAILTLLVQAGVTLLRDWLAPGWIAGIPQTMGMIISIAYFVLFVLPLFGFLLSQVSGPGRSFSTTRGEVRNGRWSRGHAE
jgi:hypothetical protein